MAKYDWEAIETLYRAGILSLKEIAAKHGLSDTAIRKRAKRDGWVRDLNAKIKAKADAKVLAAEVRAQVRAENQQNESVMVEATADVIAKVRIEHRADIRRARSLTNVLFDELQTECADLESLQRLGEMMRSPDDRGVDKLNDLYHKVIELPSRVKAMKDLTDALKTIVALEREAYSIYNEPAGAKQTATNVMLVPSASGVDDWEQQAMAQQDMVLNR